MIDPSNENGYGEGLGYGEGSGYRTDGYGEGLGYGNGAAFGADNEGNVYTPPDHWRSGYQENPYDSGWLLDTPYQDTSAEPNPGVDAWGEQVSAEGELYQSPSYPELGRCIIER